MNRNTRVPFVFSDNTHVPAGNTICVPLQAMMQDPEYYSDPLEFQGDRFVTRREDGAASTSRFSHPSLRFPFWGSVSSPWYVLWMQFSPGKTWTLAYVFGSPGRFYVSMVVKMILVWVIENYDIKLADEDAKSHFSWGINMVINPRLTFLIRERKRESL